MKNKLFFITFLFIFIILISANSKPYKTDHGIIFKGNRPIAFDPLELNILNEDTSIYINPEYLNNIYKKRKNIYGVISKTIYQPYDPYPPPDHIIIRKIKYNLKKFPEFINKNLYYINDNFTFVKEYWKNSFYYIFHFINNKVYKVYLSNNLERYNNNDFNILKFKIINNKIHFNKILKRKVFYTIYLKTGYFDGIYDIVEYKLKDYEKILNNKINLNLIYPKKSKYKFNNLNLNIIANAIIYYVNDYPILNLLYKNKINDNIESSFNILSLTINPEFLINHSKNNYESIRDKSINNKIIIPNSQIIIQYNKKNKKFELHTISNEIIESYNSKTLDIYGTNATENIYHIKFDNKSKINYISKNGHTWYKIQYAILDNNIRVYTDDHFLLNKTVYYTIYLKCPFFEGIYDIGEEFF